MIKDPRTLDGGISDEQLERIKKICPKCQGRGYVDEYSGLGKARYVHTCWDCLKNGRL
jgi:DnaJ-class molecular chaperone